MSKTHLRRYRSLFQRQKTGLFVNLGKSMLLDPDLDTFSMWIRIRIQDRQVNADGARTGSKSGILILLLR
jgi:hypothetical protein